MAYEPATSSGSLAVGTNTVSTKPGLLCNLVLNPGSAASSITVYDNATAASGTVLCSLLATANGQSVTASIAAPIVVNNGITVVVAGTAATATLSYTAGG